MYGTGSGLGDVNVAVDAGPVTIEDEETTVSELVWRTNRAARPLVAALGLVVLQVVALVVVVVIGFASLLSHGTPASAVVESDTTATGDTSWGLIIAAVLVGAVLALLGWALAHGRGWARGPLVTVELLAVFAGISTATSDQPFEGVALGLPAAIIVVLLFLPGVSAATTSPHRRRGAYPED